MPSFKVEGIILKRRDFGEADRILTVFSLQRGKISVLAKGVRRITSRRAGNVELLNRVILYLYQGKQFYYLNEAEALDTYPKLKAELTLSTYAFHILELVERLTAEEQENTIVYEYLVEVLKRLSKNPRQILIRAFEAKLLSNLGFISFLDTEDLLRKLQSYSWDEIEKIKINEKEALETERVLRYYVEKVIEKPLKSRRFLKKI